MNNVFFLKNAKIVPYSIDCKESHDKYIHGIVHDELTGPEQGLVRGEEKKLLINEQRRNEVCKDLIYKYEQGTHFYVGPFINQFGHLVAQTLSRAWAYIEYKDKIDKILILGRTPTDSLLNMPKHVTDLFRFFGFDFEKILFITEAIETENLILPRQSHGIGFREPWFDIKYSVHYKNGEYIDANNPKKVFISRRHYKSQGRLAGLDMIASVLKKNGYVEIFPEKLTIEEQIKIFVNAENIVAEEGSALHMLDIIPSINAKVFLISRRRNYKTFMSLLSKVSSEVYLFDDVNVINSGERDANALSVSFTLHSLIYKLKENSFISNDEFSQTNLNSAIIDDISLFYKSKKT